MKKVSFGLALMTLFGSSVSFAHGIELNSILFHEYRDCEKAAHEISILGYNKQNLRIHTKCEEISPFFHHGYRAKLLTRVEVSDWSNSNFVEFHSIDTNICEDAKSLMLRLNRPGIQIQSACEYFEGGIRSDDGGLYHSRLHTSMTIYNNQE